MSEEARRHWNESSKHPLFLKVSQRIPTPLARSVHCYANISGSLLCGKPFLYLGLFTHNLTPAGRSPCPRGQGFSSVGLSPAGVKHEGSPLPPAGGHCSRLSSSHWGLAL